MYSKLISNVSELHLHPTLVLMNGDDWLQEKLAKHNLTPLGLVGYSVAGVDHQIMGI